MSEDESTPLLAKSGKEEGPSTPRAWSGEEEAWAARAVRGDRTAFATLYARYAKVVHGMAVAGLGVGRAEDLVQDVFLKALAKLSELRDPSALPAWIVSVARNLITDEQRRHRRSTEELSEEPVGRAEPRTEAKEVLRAVFSLPRAYQETLILRLVEGMTGPEIAARTGLTPGSVRVNLCRGFKMLQEKLGEGGRP